MFFRKSPYAKAREATPARVLGLYSGTFIGEIRIKPYLNALLGRGVIADYVVADRSLRSEGLSGTFAFTHIWCQRNVSTAQFRFLKAHADMPIIYDMDDLLTSMPRFVASSKGTMMKRIAWCLEHARAITVATPALERSLREDAPAAGRKTVLLANGCAEAGPPSSRQQAKCLVWTSSDTPFFLQENPAFVKSLADLLNSEGYEAILIGRFDESQRKLFSQVRHIGHLDFASYRAYLRTLAGSLAIAPMPTRLPAEAQRYFDAKSDVKLVDYLSCGLTPIVSNAVPYSSSELFVPELAAANADEMLQRIAACIADRDGVAGRVDTMIHQRGLLKQREFSALSKPLDSLFA